MQFRKKATHPRLRLAHFLYTWFSQLTKLSLLVRFKVTLNARFAHSASSKELMYGHRMGIIYNRIF